MISKLKEARSRGVPLVAVRTSDQPETVRLIKEGFKSLPLLAWDPNTGPCGLNDAGEAARQRAMPEGDALMFSDPVEFFKVLKDLPERTVVVMVGGSRVVDQIRPAISAMQVRDPLASNGVMVVLLGASFKFAAELGNDVHVIDDPLPNEAQRGAIVEQMAIDAGVTIPAEQKALAVAYTRGLSAFAAGQTIALSMTPKGLDETALRSRWREAVNATPGLRVVDDANTTMDEIAGLDYLKTYATRVVNGKQKVDCIVWIDEIEKVLAGSSGEVADSSGASQSILGAILTAMQETEAQGMLLVGPPGTGKSLCAKTIGAAAKAPTIQLSPGNLKGSLVGDTEANAERCMKTIRAIGGNCFWVATSNNLKALPPELLRRFATGIWFVDLPDRKELNQLWELHCKAHGLTLPLETDDTGYSGADVWNVCRMADNLGLTVDEAAKDYLPASFAARKTIETLRQSAVGAYRSAHSPGPYKLPKDTSTKGRKFSD
jgi:ATPase family associated with various cellular activities (AAA)